MANDIPDNYGSAFGADFQGHILAVMCKVPGFCIRYRTALDHTFFVDKMHRAIARVLLQRVDQDRVLPTLATFVEYASDVVSKEELPAFRATVEKLFSSDVRDHEAVARRTVEFGKQQALVNAILKSAEMLDRGDHNVRPLIDKAMTVGEDLLNIGLDYCAEVGERLRWYTEIESQADTVPTGLTHLDQILGGGLGRGELGVVLAPPNRGKSACLINFGFGALANLRKFNVVHYSMEMSKRRVTMRYDDRVMGAHVKYKTTDPEQYVGELEKRVKLFPGRLFIQSYPTRSAGLTTLRAHLALLASRDFQPDLVIVDYADIMRPERRVGEMRHEQAGIYEDLRQLAGEFNCAVWTGSQAKSSALEKDTITIADFAEAFEKAAIVDVALGLCQTTDERIDARARLFAAKVRNAEDGRTIECEYQRDRCLLRSVGALDIAGSRLADVGDQQTQGASSTTSDTGDEGLNEKKIRQSLGLVPTAIRKKVVSPNAPKLGVPHKRRISDGPRRDLHPPETPR